MSGSRGPWRGAHVTNENVVNMEDSPYPQHEMEAVICHLEEEAYCWVLRAFIARSDQTTWLLNRVQYEDIIRRIRKWRSLHTTLSINPQPIRDLVPGPTTSVRKRPKTAQPIIALHPEQLATAPSSSTVRKGVSPGPKAQKVAGDSTPKFMLPAAGTKGREPHMNRNFPGGPPEISQQHSVDPLTGHKVNIWWPDDKCFYEAVISDYNAETGQHMLVYDMHTPEETWEWIDLKEQRQEDIRWLKNESVQSQQGAKRRPIFGSARGKGLREKAPMEDALPQHDGAGKSRSGEIIICNTESLIREVEKAVDAANPDPRKVKQAWKVLEVQETNLIDAISRLAEVPDEDDDSGDDDEEWEM